MASHAIPRPQDLELTPRAYRGRTLGISLNMLALTGDNKADDGRPDPLGSKVRRRPKAISECILARTFVVIEDYRSLYC